MELMDCDFYMLVDYMRNHYGINLASKRHLIKGRLEKIVTEGGYSSYGEYLQYALSSGAQEEITTLLNRLTTNHTFFMREQPHFDFFKRTVLPELKNSVRDRDLRIWSAGCSSGEEPYMLAIIMQEFFGGEACLWDKTILATDICREVLEKALTGIYTAEDIGKIEPYLKNRYFQKAGPNTFQVKDELKKEVIFRVFNLMNDFPFKKKFHVIFCRNVMIYFNQETKNRLIKKFYDMTEDGGYLFIGLSESLKREETPYTYVMPSVYRKRV